MLSLETIRKFAGEECAEVIYKTWKKRPELRDASTLIYPIGAEIRLSAGSMAEIIHGNPHVIVGENGVVIKLMRAGDAFVWYEREGGIWLCVADRFN
jgi:hypothetical protein